MVYPKFILLTVPSTNETKKNEILCQLDFVFFSSLLDISQFQCYPTPCSSLCGLGVPINKREQRLYHSAIPRTVKKERCTHTRYVILRMKSKPVAIPFHGFLSCKPTKVRNYYIVLCCNLSFRKYKQPYQQVRK